MEKIIDSIAFYLAVCFVLLFFAVKIDMNKNVRFSICMLILILSLVAGLRHQTVGIDTQGYVTLTSQLRNGYLLKLNNITEQGFIFLSFILVNISEEYTLSLLVYSFITNTLIILRLYDYKNKISFTWAVFIYYMLFYFSTFNTIRQWIAVALVFFGTRYIGRSNIKFIICVILAVLMHTTAIFAFFYFPLYYFSYGFSKKISSTIKKGVMLIFAYAAGVYVYETIIGRYDSYISSAVYGDISWVNIVLILIMCFIILYDNNWKIVIKKSSNGINLDEKINIRYETLAFFIGIILTLMVFLTRYADRVGQYFLLFEVIFFPYYIKKKKTRVITIAVVLLFCLYIRFFSFASSGYGEMPYIPFWNVDYFM